MQTPRTERSAGAFFVFLGLNATRVRKKLVEP
jgi:hypothetical protein